MLFYAKQTTGRQLVTLSVLIALTGWFVLFGGPSFSFRLGARDLFYAVLCAAGVGILDLLTALIHAVIHGRRSLNALLATLSNIFRGLGLPGAIGAGLVAGIGEELLFRGAIQPKFGIGGAVVLFTLAHMGTRPLATLFVWTALEGLWFGLLYQQTGNLVYPMIAHGIHDTAAILVLSYIRERPNHYLVRVLDPKDNQHG